jgi:protein-S-isoprenylcysteine O-methyltransferase Ste14
MTMDAVRYYLALAMLMFLPGGLLYWFSVHPFIRFWRKVGPWLTLAVHYLMVFALAAGVFLARAPLLAIQFGTNWWLAAPGAALAAFGIVLRKKLGRQLRPRTLAGLPELAPDKYPRKLLTEGVYSRLRHPRYVEIVVGLTGYALIANYLAAYLLAALAPLVLLLVVKIEEKELRERFGAEYEEYCARVPRFVPRSWRLRAPGN